MYIYNMPEQIDTDFIWPLLTAVLVLSGIIWQNLLHRVDKLEKIQATLPFHALVADISVIKKDIEWMKSLFMTSHKTYGKSQ